MGLGSLLSLPEQAHGQDRQTSVGDSSAHKAGLAAEELPSCAWWDWGQHEEPAQLSTILLTNPPSPFPGWDTSLPLQDRRSPELALAAAEFVAPWL